MAWACTKGHLPIVILFVERGMSIDQNDNVREQPLPPSPL
jgi:hypothetical protein